MHNSEQENIFKNADLCRSPKIMSHLQGRKKDLTEGPQHH